MSKERRWFVFFQGGRKKRFFILRSIPWAWRVLCLEKISNFNFPLESWGGRRKIKSGRTVHQSTGHYHTRLGEPLISGVPERAAFVFCKYRIISISKKQCLNVFRHLGIFFMAFSNLEIPPVVFKLSLTAPSARKSHTSLRGFEGL